MNIVTGYRGEPHITAVQDRMTNRGIIGTGKYVLDGATQMTASIISNNEIRIYGGTISINGCIAVIENGSYESAAIESGAQGMNRIDLIYAKYQKDSVTGVESVSVAVRKGTATAGTPEPPAVWAGDVDDGSSTVEMGLYLVTITGVNITGLDRYSSPIPTVYSMGTTKLDRTGDAQYTTMTFNSSDALDPVSTVSVGLLSTGATLRSIIEKVSGAVRNLRYVMKQVGSAAIANVAASITEAIGNTALGTTATTISGAIAEHEGDLAELSALSVESISSTYSSNIRIFRYGHLRILVIEAVSGLNASGDTTLCTLPQGDRPAAQVNQDFFPPSASNVNVSLRVYVATNGNVRIYNYSTTTGTINVRIRIPYLVGV